MAIRSAFDSPIPGAQDAPRRPVGILLVSIVLLLSGLFVGGQHIYSLRLYFSAEGPVTMSGPYTAMLVGDGLLAVASLCSAVGLFVGAKWGWCLAGLHWTWRLGREAIVPWLANTLWAGSSSHLDAGRDSTNVVRLAFVCLMLLYLFRRNVLSFFQLESMSRSLALAGLCIVGFSLALILDPLEGPLGSLFGDEESEMSAFSRVRDAQCSLSSNGLFNAFSVIDNEVWVTQGSLRQAQATLGYDM
jgi:hypothetical protein